VAERVLETLVSHGADFFVSVPCNTLTDLLRLLDGDARVKHVPVTREEEGAGVCAGAALAGRLPVMLMQNSGLGNCLNAILSLTQLYRLPLVILATYRGGPDETIVAQLPMGSAMRPLLNAVHVPFHEIASPEDVGKLADLVAQARAGAAVAGILHPSLWKAG
jgi:sulfopyruvate decarboxylase subunit alpha